MLTAAALSFLVNVATSLLQWVMGKFGRVATQVVVFVLALVAALFVHFDFFTPGIKAYFLTAVAIFVVAVTFYEVVLQYFPFFKGPST